MCTCLAWRASNAKICEETRWENRRICSKKTAKQPANFKGQPARKSQGETLCSCTCPVWRASNAKICEEFRGENRRICSKNSAKPRANFKGQPAGKSQGETLCSCTCLAWRASNAKICEDSRGEESRICSYKRPKTRKLQGPASTQHLLADALAPSFPPLQFALAFALCPCSSPFARSLTIFSLLPSSLPLLFPLLTFRHPPLAHASLTFDILSSLLPWCPVEITCKLVS